MAYLTMPLNYICLLSYLGPKNYLQHPMPRILNLGSSVGVREHTSLSYTKVKLYTYIVHMYTRIKHPVEVVSVDTMRAIEKTNV
jgi:hypothetical protein